MAEAEVLIDEDLTLSERYRVELRAYKIRPSRKYPEGVKVRYVLVDVIAGKPRILIDNHTPYGFQFILVCRSIKLIECCLKLPTTLKPYENFASL